MAELNLIVVKPTIVHANFLIVFILAHWCSLKLLKHVLWNYSLASRELENSSGFNSIQTQGAVYCCSVL